MKVPRQLTLEPGEQVVEVIAPGIFVFRAVALAVGLLILAASVGNVFWTWKKFERAEAKHEAALQTLEDEAKNPPDWMKNLPKERVERSREKARSRLMVSQPSLKQTFAVPAMSLCFSLIVLGVILLTGRRPPKAIVVTNLRAFISRRKQDTSVYFARVASLAVDSHGVHMTGVAGAINRSMADAAQQNSPLNPGYWSRAAGIYVHYQDGSVDILDSIPPSGLGRLGPAMTRVLQQHQAARQQPAIPHS